MSDIKQITPDNKRKLVGLVNKLASYVQTGSTPTEALVKAANDGDYPPDFLLRAAEAYNGAAHLSHFKQASTDNRGDSFPLCDGAAAVQQIYKEQKIATTYEQVDVTVFAKEANTYFVELAPETVVKAAAVNLLPTISEAMKAAHSLDLTERLTTERYRNLYNNSCQDLATSIIKFRTKTAAVSPARKLEWAREAIEKFGSANARIISMAVGLSVTDCTKSAAQKVGFFSLGNEDVQSLFNLVTDAQQMNLLHEKFATAEAELYMNRIERTHYLNKAAGIKSTSILNSMSSSFGDITDMLPNEDSSAAKGKALNSLLDPEYVRSTGEIDKALALKDVMSNDPVISKRPPSEINTALSEVSDLAPTATSYPALLRSMLRKRLELGQQMSDLDLNQMMTMEKGIRDNESINILPKLTGEGGGGGSKDKN